MQPDVLILGGGPSALAAGAALCDLNLRVAFLSPAPPAPWHNTYGVWVDEVAPLGYAPFLAASWDDVRVNFGAGERVLERTYGLLDNARLQAKLLEQTQSAPWHTGFAASVEHDSSGSTVKTREGHEYRATLVLDSSGHSPALVQRPAGEPAFQAAYGVLGTFSAPPIAEGSMMLMDYRNDYGEAEDPTFLYAMSLGEGRYFLEETSLAGRPGVSFHTLERRLMKRLEVRGVRLLETESVERCLFPMNLPLPDLSQRVVGFGGAASMVHPASGYMVSSVLRTAPVLAQAVAEALPRGAAGVSSAAWHAVWPPERVRRRQLYLFGLETLLKFSGDELRAFFRSFFALPPSAWQGYLSGTLGSREVSRTMLRLFLTTSPTVRLALMRSTLSRDARLLLRALR